MARYRRILQYLSVAVLLYSWTVFLPAVSLSNPQVVTAMSQIDSDAGSSDDDNSNLENDSTLDSTYELPTSNESQNDSQSTVSSKSSNSNGNGNGNGNGNRDGNNGQDCPEDRPPVQNGASVDVDPSENEDCGINNGNGPCGNPNAIANNPNCNQGPSNPPIECPSNTVVNGTECEPINDCPGEETGGGSGGASGSISFSAFSAIESSGGDSDDCTEQPPVDPPVNPPVDPPTTPVDECLDGFVLSGDECVPVNPEPPVDPPVDPPPGGVDDEDGGNCPEEDSSLPVFAALTLNVANEDVLEDCIEGENPPTEEEPPPVDEELPPVDEETPPTTDVEGEDGEDLDPTDSGNVVVTTKKPNPPNAPQTLVAASPSSATKDAAGQNTLPQTSGEPNNYTFAGLLLIAISAFILGARRRYNM